MSEIGKAEGSGNRVRVLLADDNPLVLERVKALLQSTFDVVGVAHDGLELVDEAMRLSPDIIVADISMPELDGIQAAHRLREIGAKATIVFLTIHESPEFVEACLAEGALGFVVKSQMKADLIPAITPHRRASALYLPTAAARDFIGRRFVCASSNTVRAPDRRSDLQHGCYGGDRVNGRVEKSAISTRGRVVDRSRASAVFSQVRCIRCIVLSIWPSRRASHLEW